MSGEAQRFTVLRTEPFERWLSRLRDKLARDAIERRLVRLQAGNAGDTRAVGGGVAELRVDVGPGYRVYFVYHGNAIIVLLCGGDKSSQARDIATAKELARTLP